MLQLNFNPFPGLKTDRLCLQQMSLNHKDDLYALRTNEDCMKYIDRPRPKSVQEVEELIKKMETAVIQNEAVSWGIFLKDQPELVGTISYHKIIREHYRAEVGYLLHPNEWGKGYVSEALQKVLEFGFETMGLHSIEAHINPDNVASRNLLKKFGFIKEAYLKESYFFNNLFLDTEIYSLLKN